MPRLDLPADENVDLEELEQFAKEFKQRRIKLGKQKMTFHDELFFFNFNSTIQDSLPLQFYFKVTHKETLG